MSDKFNYLTIAGTQSSSWSNKKGFLYPRNMWLFWLTFSSSIGISSLKACFELSFFLGRRLTNMLYILAYATVSTLPQACGNRSIHCFVFCDADDILYLGWGLFMHYIGQIRLSKHCRMPTPEKNNSDKCPFFFRVWVECWCSLSLCVKNVYVIRGGYLFHMLHHHLLPVLPSIPHLEKVYNIHLGLVFYTFTR